MSAKHMLECNKLLIAKNFRALFGLLEKAEINSDLELTQAKNNEISLKVIDAESNQTKIIHSLYNPSEEAENFINSFEIKKILFL